MTVAEKVAEKEKNEVKAVFDKVYLLLEAEYGDLKWWPAETPYEVMLGAILTQNTNWKNVERAIDNLKEADCITADAVDAVAIEKLAELIRPSGYFNIKADRIKNFNSWYLVNGQYLQLSKIDTEKLRKMLLSINGVGHETADDILLYAFDRPVFVIDAYYRRVFSRIGIVTKKSSYEHLRLHAQQHIKQDVKLYNQYHALLVEHCKKICKVKPVCHNCVLRKKGICKYITE